MRDFIHRFYPYQILKLTLQRLRSRTKSTRPRIESTSTSSTASDSKHILSSQQAQASSVAPVLLESPFDAVKARSQLASYFRALKQAHEDATISGSCNHGFIAGKASKQRQPQQQQQQQQELLLLESLRQSVSHRILGFHLEVAPSQIPNSGLGLFLRLNLHHRKHHHDRVLSPGTIVAMYPGTLYSPGEAIFFNSIQNRYILKCNDGVFVDGKTKGLSGAIFRSIDRRDNYPGTVKSADTSWMLDWSSAFAFASASRRVEKGGGGISTAVIKNPLAVGQIVNNGTHAFPPNVRYQELDIRTRDCPLELQEFLPNIWYSDDWHAHDHDHDNEREGEEDKKVDWSSRSLSDLDHLRTVVLVTTRPIAHDEELYSTYIEH